MEICSTPHLELGIARIQARKPVIVHAFFTADEMRVIIERVPTEGLCVIGQKEMPDEARRLQGGVMGWRQMHEWVRHGHSARM